ncbi:MAG: hypothetical protein KME60_12795 [Cyanomargarita calcarea GSE-NOS-MK-12-04C]|jgi:hypothetical protein|uniref:Uncharacterized protein n=1 Tax=Cyanomargarita calcarea GSE-NOS-MK-12-04C TaxID=2839659 RepID=A0A951QLL6_9CYAN|nr:hypothetical protein [Cyanomargarita calcarea GSE-NOS-MK-12-04C]
MLNNRLSQQAFGLASLTPLEAATSSLNAALFATTSLLDVQSSNGHSAESFPDIFNNLKQIQGDLSFNYGEVTSNITSPFGLLEGTFNLEDLGNNLASSLQQLDGNLNLINGVLSSNFTTPSVLSQDTFDLAGFVGNLMGSYLQQIQGSVPFENGLLNINSPTPLGNINGIMNLGDGKFVTDLNTPFGKINNLSYFPANTQLPFSVNNLAGIIDFSTGQLSIDTLPNQDGGDVAIPISSLSGTMNFSNGVANMNIPTSFGDVSTNFNFSQLAASYVTESLKGNGVVNFNGGLMNIDVTGPLGLIQSSVNISQLAKDSVSSLQQAQGIINFNNGVLSSNLNTSLGSLIGSIDLNTFTPIPLPSLPGVPVSEYSVRPET